MTTQPSDWAVAKAWREISESHGFTYRLVMQRARELDASGGGVEPFGYFDPDVMAHLADGNIDPVGVLRRKPNGISTVPVYLTPRAAEAGEWIDKPVTQGWHWHWDGEIYNMRFVFPRPGHSYLAIQEETGSGKRHFTMTDRMGGKWFGPIPLPTPPQAAMGAVGAGD